MVDKTEALESKVSVCWYQTPYERYLSQGNYPLDACKDCLPDESNSACPHYNLFASNFDNYELAKKYILYSRKLYKK